MNDIDFSTLKVEKDDVIVLSFKDSITCTKYGTYAKIVKDTFPNNLVVCIPCISDLSVTVLDDLIEKLIAERDKRLEKEKLI